MCEGIARAGNGVCLMALNSTEIIGKCAQLLRAGCTRLLKKVTVDWGVTSDVHPNTTLSQRRGAPTAQGLQSATPPFIRQTPFVIPTLYPSVRLVVYAILQTDKIPSKVTIKGTLGDGNEVLNLSVPVEPIRLSQPSSPSSPVSTSTWARSAGKAMLIHTLAAHRLIQDLQEGRVPSPEAAIRSEAITKSAVVKLGERYQLASEYTSFIAVDSEETRARHVGGRHREGDVMGGRRERGQGRDGLNEWVDVSRNEPGDANDSGYVSWALGAVWRGVSWAFGYTPAPVTNVRQSGRTGSRSSERVSDESAGEVQGAESGDSNPEGGYDSAATYSTMSSLESYSSRESSPGRLRARRRPSIQPPPPPSPPQSERRSPSPVIQLGNKPSSGGPHDADFSSQKPGPLQREVEMPVIDLMKLQAFDGSFVLGRELERIVGPLAMREWENISVAHVESEVWATALAMAFLEKHLSGQAELIECLKDKIMEYVDGKTQMAWGDFLALVRHAEGLVL